jgi:hypothetical protein
VRRSRRDAATPATRGTAIGVIVGVIGTEPPSIFAANYS